MGDGYSETKSTYVNENSILLFYYIYLLYMSFGIYVIYGTQKKASITFKFPLI